MPPKRRTPQRGPGPRNNRPAQPGGAARPSRPVRRAPEPAGPRPRFTNRATILLVVLAVLVVSYASSMRAYLNQRSQIADAKSQIAEDRARIAGLKAEKRRWSDPAFVEQQARERFGWVMPGETSYQVLDAHGDPLTGDDRLTDPSTIDPEDPEGWWVAVRESVDAADHPEKLKQKPPPATTITPKTP